VGESQALWADFAQFFSLAAQFCTKLRSQEDISIIHYGLWLYPISGHRILPVGNNLIQDLQRHYDLQKERIVFMGSSWKGQNLVFPSSIGTPLQAGYPEKACKQIFSAIGLDDSFTFHNLRHTAASIMLNRGMSIVEVSKYLGHSSPSFTANIYAHLMPGGLEKAVDVFDRVIPVKH
jgi:integrase